ncbi:MAG: peptide deformylase [Verrucomicrobia bacterium]|nr:peptide deformylase [Verrucomicrobiota bacterium]
MIRPVVHYGEPILRQKGKPVGEITAEVRAFVADLFDTMYEAKGIGLAAQQAGRAWQIFIIDVRGVTDRPSTIEWEGHPPEVERCMPLVFIDPKVRPLGAEAAGPEGCLSFPELYADISRPESTEVEARDLDGNPFRFRCGGLLARAIQHEYDHLQGVLFIDRMSRKTREELKADIDEIQAETKRRIKGAG